jgi:hypothetical protein
LPVQTRRIASLGLRINHLRHILTLPDSPLAPILASYESTTYGTHVNTDKHVADLERMAREAGLTDPDLAPWMTDYGYAKDEILRFAALVRADALEDAAKMCESLWMVDGTHTAKEFAAEIRALKDAP